MSAAREAELRAQLLAGEPLDLGALEPLLRRSYPELGLLGGVREGGESALERTQRVLALVQPRLGDLAPEQAQALYLAALLHEIGRGPLAGEDITVSRHQLTGAPLARDILFRLGLPSRLRDHVVYLVRSHTLPFVSGRRPVSAGRLLRLAWTLDTRLLYLLAHAACQAAGPAGERRLGAVDAFARRCRELDIFGRQPPPLLSPRTWNHLAPADPSLRRRLAGELRYWRLKGAVNDREEARAWLAAQRPEPAGTLYLPVGVPGSGKSTWVAQHVPGARLVSMDEMRRELTGARADQSRNPEVFRRCRAILGRALRAGEVVAWDAQSHTWAARQGLLTLARETHAYIVIIFMDVPLAVALERNARRGEMVPPAVVLRSYRGLEEPSPFEAEEIWRVGADEQCTRCGCDEGVGA